MLGRALRLAILMGLLVPASASAGITATVVGTFSSPTYIAAPPGDTHRLFVVQQSGQIELIKDGQKQATPFLDISSEVTDVGGEQGLLSMAFSPDYATSHRFYVYYTTKNCPQSPGCDEQVSDFTADSSGDTASAASERVLTRSRTRLRAITTVASSSSVRTAICTSRWAMEAAGTTPR